MIFRDRRLPLVVGVLLLSGTMMGLYRRSPLPAPLSHPHAQLPGMQDISSCASCHHEDGIDAGCLGCHAEIDEQLRRGRGLHHQLVAEGSQGCGDCHQEHHGEGFALLGGASWGPEGREAFDHGHVEFGLHGQHDALQCSECHLGRRVESFRLPAFPHHVRAHTFLGLRQDCSSCHDDPHARGLAQDCATCHGQEHFDPAEHFDHDRHFALRGAHARRDCEDCHDFPERDAPPRPHPFPFDGIESPDCDQCHDSPHQFDFGDDCSSCHRATDPEWVEAHPAMTPQIHAVTGFLLEAPHDQAECRQCHRPHRSFAERHPDPRGERARTPDRCDLCHKDVHAGQFERGGSARACLECHDRHFFQPSTIGHREHARRYPLVGAHAATICTECHRRPERGAPRRYADTSHSCRDCHATPHGRQFAERIARRDCTECHSEHIDTFRLPGYDHLARTGFALEGAHAELHCDRCHTEAERPGPDGPIQVRRYENTPTDCAGCHEDVHRGQFADGDGCTDCHSSQFHWDEIAFDHDSQSSFPLIGAHRKADCTSCHRSVPVGEGRFFVRYKPIAHECGDCHEVASRDSRSDR